MEAQGSLAAENDARQQLQYLTRWFPRPCHETEVGLENVKSLSDGTSYSGKARTIKSKSNPAILLRLFAFYGCILGCFPKCARGRRL
jgi:hypothetical protein